VLFVLEDNGIAQTTPVGLAVAGSMSGRFEAFGCPVTELDTSDVLEIHAAAGESLKAVRTDVAPRALVVHTCRFGPHSKGDDTRTADEVAELRSARDPLAIHGVRLDVGVRASIDAQVADRVAAAFEAALADPAPALA
jgi:pyruvate dehydrogenase E1 component alpha subunit/2-oxoisovalerate dehydrogenase E1 component